MRVGNTNVTLGSCARANHVRNTIFEINKLTVKKTSVNLLILQYQEHQKSQNDGKMKRKEELGFIQRFYFMSW